MTTQLQTIRESFFNTVFSLLGHMANCDGYINRNEIKRIEIYMEKMSLSEHCKREAKQLFRTGTSPQFNINQVLAEFKKNSTPNLVQILLVYLISMARTDGLLVKKEMNMVQKVANELGYNSIVFDHLLKMIAAQDEFGSDSQAQKNAQPQHNSQAQQKESKNQQYKQEWKKEQPKNNFNKNFYRQNNSLNKDLQDAYEALNANVTMTDEEIRRTYQKLVSQFHPDKLVGQGMPPDLVNAATERFKKIQAAYEFLKQKRSIDTAA